MTTPANDIANLVVELREWLGVQQALGVLTEPLGAEPPPADQAATPPADQAATPPADQAATPPPTLADWAATARASSEASQGGVPFGAETLATIRNELGDCRRCPLHQGRTNLVFGVGDPHADLVVVGEAPGYREDQTGEPFVGPAGQMLDRMLANVLGLQRAQVHILNVVKCRPPNNRNPHPDEVATCLPFLARQIQAIAPKVILVLGSVALRSMAEVPGGIVKNRGRWREYLGIPTLPTFHPAYLLRRPGEKRKTFEDLKALRTRYDALGGKR